MIALYLAQRTADQLDIESAERAVRLAPDDAEFPHLLGLQLSATGRDDAAAISNLRKAVTLNPNPSPYWFDLASEYHSTGNVNKASATVQSALKAEPGNPEVAAEAAQYFLAAGDTDRALSLFRQALGQNPQAADVILPLCWSKTGNAHLLLSKLVTDSPELQLALLQMLAEQKESSAANVVWQHLVSSNKPFDPKLSFFYFDYLLKEHDVTGFDQAWHALAGRSPGLRTYLSNDNLMVNGGFEQQLLNAGFDWRHEPADHLTAGIDDTVAHSGTHSLSLWYDGSPAYDAGWTQFVPVQPNTDYEFSAWIKSDSVTSSSGPRIAVADAHSGVNLLLTDDALDTHPWQQMKGSLRVPAGVEMLSVKIIRAPADTGIRGRVWIDDLRLAKR